MTTQTMQDRLLLRPSPELNEIVLGVLGRALQVCPGVGVVAFVFFWNAYEMMLRVLDASAMSRFIGHVNGNLGREAGRLHTWKARFWRRRYDDVQVIDQAAAEDRLRRVLAIGVDDGLVERPTDWPGASSVVALLRGTPIRGLWFDRTREYAARRLRKPVGRYDFATAVDVPLVPLPGWETLCDLERQARCANIVASIEQEAAARIRTEGWRPPGPQYVLAQRPHTLPAAVERSPSSTPPCHASSGETWQAHRAIRAEVAQAFHAAAACVRGGRPQDVRFPPGCFPPSLPFVPAGRAIVGAPVDVAPRSPDRTAEVEARRECDQPCESRRSPSAATPRSGTEAT